LYKKEILMKNFAKAVAKAGIAAALFGASASANASIVWNWSFQGEVGTFTTSGTALGNVATPGTYDLEDFSVAASATGRPLGTLLGGQYLSAFGAQDDFQWSGSAVTQWRTNARQHFLFFVDSVNEHSYFFGWNGLALDVGGGSVSSESIASSYGPVNVSLPGNTIGAVPEPAAWAMMIAGFGVVGGAARRRRETMGTTYV
jgi:PEP-CTERM motif